MGPSSRRQLYSTLGLGLFSAAAAVVAFRLTAEYGPRHAHLHGPSDATFAGGAVLFAAFSAVRLLVPIICPARSPFSVDSSRSAMDLALARILFLLIYAQNVSFRRSPPALTAGKETVLTGLWGSLAAWHAEWVSVAWWEPHAITLLVALALAGGICTRPCIFCLAILEMRSHVLMQTHMTSYYGHHKGHLFLPALLLFGLAPCADALNLWAYLSRSETRQSLAAQRVKRPEYTVPFTALLLIMANAYLTAAIPKLTDCGARSTYSWPFDDSFWSTGGLSDIIRKEYFSKCDGRACLDPSAVRWRPLCLDTIGALVTWAWDHVFGDGSARRPGLHAACLLGDSYLNPAFRFDQLPPIMLRAAALSAVIWEACMWLCVLHPGPARWLAVCFAFLFHQGNLWMTSIRFEEFADMYVVWVPWAALLALIRGRADGSSATNDDREDLCSRAPMLLADEDAVADAASLDGRSPASLEEAGVGPRSLGRCSANWLSSSGNRSQLLVALFSIMWGTLRLRPGIPEAGAYPLARFPEFCRSRYTTRPGAVNVPFLREVRLLAASANTPGEFALLARLPLHKTVRRKSERSVAQTNRNICFKPNTRDAVGHLLRELPSLGVANWTAVTHVQFVIMRFPLDNNSSLRSQLDSSNNVYRVILVDLNFRKLGYSQPPLAAYPPSFASDSGPLSPPAAADSHAWVRSCPRAKATQWLTCLVTKGPDPTKPATVTMRPARNPPIWHVCAPPCRPTCNVTAKHAP